MNLQLFTFFTTHFPSLNLVQFSATQFQIWDKWNIIWAKIEIQKGKVKFISIQQKSIQLLDFEKSQEQELQFLEELNNLQIAFYQTSRMLLEQAKNDFIQRKKEIETNFRTGFSAKQKEDLQPIIQLLEEGGHSIYLLSEWIAIFEFWKTIYEKSNFKKSFFQRQEILKSLTSFFNNSHKISFLYNTPISYSKLEKFVFSFAKENKIKENEILLYGILNEFLNDTSNKNKQDSKLDFIPIIQQKINQKTNQNKPKKIWINDTLILKSVEKNTENQEFNKNVLVATFENFADLLLGFSTQNESSQFVLEAKKPISQVGIFGLSKNSELLNKLNLESNYDLIILNPDKQNLYYTKEISIFHSLSKTEKQLFVSLQNGFKSLSKNGILIVLLDENQNDLVEKKSLAVLRRLLAEWFERIEIYESENNVILLFYKKTEVETQKGVFYYDSNKNESTNFVPSTWITKPILSDYQKLIPALNEKGNKNAIFKIYFKAIASQKIENFIEANSELNSNSENNLKIKVKQFIENQNQQIIKLEERENSKLEKKKNVLVSKLAKNTLFEKDILEKIRQEIRPIQNQDVENTQKLIYFDEKNVIKTQISVFEEGFWYYEKESIQEFYDLEILFPNRKQGENILIFWANTEHGGQIWATDKPVPSSFLNAILPNAYIFPFYIYDNGKKKSNFSKNTLHKFRRGYATAFEKRTEKVEEAIQTLFDLSDFEFLQVNQELAFALQTLSSTMNADENKIAKEFRDNLHNPKTNTYIQFEQIKRVFTNTKRTFERLENKAARNKESFDTLYHYFKSGEKAIDFLEKYWEKLEAEEASNFVVPTEENMTDKLILGYIFAVWQRDIFKSKYKEELKNEIPRIPIYKDFHHFANQGEFLLQKYLKESPSKIEFEIVEVFEEKVSKNKSSAKIWFEKENKIWFDKTTFLQPIIEFNQLDFDKIKKFKINEKSFFEFTLTYLRKNKIELDKGKIILEKVIEFLSK